ncbi:WD40/YVTN/BNR-like repeat-containing protein [Marilutibacter chinensis]|uniref:Uncharacterized protein n=1 Tax=Marilutibacter chinensis TaxID=2912247 RepID=A0ABS9HUL7_9GAMM|nr:hypothetical protein [Lysobacter chinensis]MCF7221870.1 hypothetical protein [Lysobacter chinensis]
MTQPQPWSRLFSHVTGVVRYHDLVYIASVSDETQARGVAHSYITEWDAGLWRVGDEGEDVQPWAVVAATVVHEPIEQALFIGNGGEVICIGSGDTHEERLPSGRNGVGGRGPIRGVCAVDGVAHACGAGRQVYRRHGVDDWRAMDTGARPAAGDTRVVGFEAIAGFDRKDLYAAGLDGEIWHYGGKRWVQADSPTDKILTALCCAGDGHVYACGQAGTLLRGRGRRWEVIAHGGPGDDFWSLAWFQDTLYVASHGGLYTLDDDRLQPVAFGRLRPKSCFHLSAADGVLWSIAAKDVLAYDGRRWRRID